MDAPGSAIAPYPTLRRTLRRTALTTTLLLACATEPASAPDPSLPPRPAGALRVLLRFGPAADLDLYVTDPGHETVYYGNTPTERGGRLAEDLRCDPPGERVERVEFADPPVGRYRVGVDFPERCNLRTRAARFRVIVEAEGLHRERSGEIRLGRFQPVVLEFELPAP
ncbi:MAG: hypothetical protein ACE5FG_00850 [Myxococcota bacterium]